jgi:hypothetical protein
MLIRAVAVLLFMGAMTAAAAQHVRPWVELGSGGTPSVRAVVIADTPCPTVATDGAPVAILPSAVPDAAFPVRVCEARVPEATARLSVGNLPLPRLPETVNRIVIIGDTGCRIARFAAQDCGDPKAWPFPAIARTAAARSPDLVIHVDDYFYHESAWPRRLRQQPLRR